MEKLLGSDYLLTSFLQMTTDAMLTQKMHVPLTGRSERVDV